MDKMVANTLTGIVHFHEIPGEGKMDFAASLKALNDNGFSGYAGQQTLSGQQTSLSKVHVTE